MTAAAPLGRIVTFYSYKGGTGRSMMLANCAWLLASAGHRVLVVDWDLEAPGLQRYFAPFLTNPQLTDADGLIDLVMKYSAAAVDPLAQEKSRPPDWYHEYADVLDYTVSINWKFPGKGSLALLPSGRQGPTYAGRVNSFSWQHFYDKLGGHALFEALKQSMRQFDFVLIDSRTGVSDTAGITTVQFPDSLVVLFTLNNQSIDGASAIARSVIQQHKPGFEVFPVPTRVDNSESDKLNSRWRLALKTFGEILGSDSPTQRRDYWDEVAVPYMPKFAYEELLAPFANHISDPAVSNLLKVAVRVVKTVFDVRVEPEDYAESVRQIALDHYAGRVATMTPAEAQRATEAEVAKVEAKTQGAVQEAVQQARSEVRTEVQSLAKRQQLWTYAVAAGVVLLLAGFFMVRSWQNQAKQTSLAEAVIYGDRAAQAGNFQEALRYYNSALAADPANAAVLSGRADVYVALKDPAKALADLDHAIEARPDDLLQRVKRARVLLSQGEKDKAAADLAFVKNHDNADAPTQMAAADVYEHSGDFGTAESLYTKVLATAPSTVRALSKRAGIRSQRGDFLGAWADYRAVIAAEPGSPEAQAALEILKADGIDPKGKASPAAATVNILFASNLDGKIAQGVASAFATTRVSAGPPRFFAGNWSGDVRYFFPEDADAARQVQLTAERSLKLQGYESALKLASMQNARAKPGSVELWLPRFTAMSLGTAKVEVLWCESSGSAARDLAMRIAALKPHDATGSWETEMLLPDKAETSDYRLTSKSNGYEIGAEPGAEVQIATQLSNLIAKSGKFPPFVLREVRNSTRPTPDYLSVFVCPRGPSKY
jgi:MinD-like ATPase involved in chromosome partitioning or flagellar assembly/Tfp pilus assembly protein PilF